MTEEEVVYNTDEGPKSCTIFCNWCLQNNDYTELAGEYRDFTCCAWCRKRLKVPRHKLMRINGKFRPPGVVLR